MNEEEKQLRKLLWIRHGCSVAYLYGDDGEMYCCHCKIDFVRNTPEQIQNIFEKQNIRFLEDSK